MRSGEQETMRTMTSRQPPGHGGVPVRASGYLAAAWCLGFAAESAWQLAHPAVPRTAPATPADEAAAQSAAAIRRDFQRVLEQEMANNLTAERIVPAPANQTPRQAAPQPANLPRDERSEPYDPAGSGDTSGSVRSRHPPST